MKLLTNKTYDEMIARIAELESLNAQWETYANHLEDKLAYAENRYASLNTSWSISKGLKPAVKVNGKPNGEAIYALALDKSMIPNGKHEIAYDPDGRFIFKEKQAKPEQESKPAKQDSESKGQPKKDKSQNKQKDQKESTAESSPYDAIIAEVTKSVGKLSDREVNKISQWESGKGKSDSKEYAKRIQGMRKTK